MFSGHVFLLEQRGQTTAPVAPGIAPVASLSGNLGLVEKGVKRDRRASEAFLVASCYYYRWPPT